MRKIKLLTVALFMLFAAVPAVSAGVPSVPLTELRNYFHNNTASLPSSPLITTKKEFDAQFGMAAFMGKDGQPTPVNFKKQAVIAVVLPETDVETEIDSVSLTQTGSKELTLTYIISRGLKRGFFTQPMCIYAVSRKYAGYKVVTKAVERQDVSLTSEPLDVITYSSPVRGIHIQADVPAGNDRLSAVVRDSIVARLNAWQKDWVRQTDNTSLSLADPSAADLQQAVSTCASNLWAVMTDCNDELNKAVPDLRRSCEADLTVRRSDETGRYVTYEFVIYNFYGGAHGLSSHSGITFDKKTCQPMTLVNGDETLCKLITERLHRDYDSVEFEKEPVPMPQTLPFMKDGKIVFIYQPYEIGPFALGMPECSFYPYEIEKWLTDKTVY